MRVQSHYGGHATRLSRRDPAGTLPYMKRSPVRSRLRASVRAAVRTAVGSTWLVVTSAAATALTAGAAPLHAQDDLRLIPVPRDVVSSGAPVTIGGTITVVASSSSTFAEAAAEFAESMSARGVPARVGVPQPNDGWPVELLRADSPVARDLLRRHRVTFDTAMSAEGYVLVVEASGAHIVGASDAGVFYGLQTLKQLVSSVDTTVRVRPAVLRDWPAMRWRGVHDDVSRGPVPTLEFQKRQIRTFAAYKINVFSPYFEHTLAFRSHPLMAPPRGAMSQADARELVEYARRYHVMIVPEQQTFGHLHHALKYEIYQDIAETPHGHVLAPDQPGSLDFTRAIFAELDSIFPAPFVHLGADETFDLGRGRTKARVDSAGVGAVYVRYLTDIEQTLRTVTTDKRFLFWGDIAMNHPDLVRSLPKDMIAVGWEYGRSSGFERYLKPFLDAGMDAWIAPGVSNWGRVWPNFGAALPNIQGFAREGQALGAAGMLNTTWDDWGQALFDQTWYGILFGAAAAWQPGESSIPAFQRSFGLQFHGDTTGGIDAAQRHLIAAHEALRESGAGDASAYLFFLDPYTDEGVVDLARLRPVLSQVRVHAESALVRIAHAREQAHLREPEALAAMELGAHRIDWLAAKFQFADEIAKSFARTIDPARTEPVTWVDLADLSGINGKLQDMRNGFVLTRELYERAWLTENRPYWLGNNLARFDAEILTWQQRINAMDRARRRHARDRKLPSAEELGIPAELLVP